MKRRDQILAAILALQVALSAVVFWPRPETPAGGGPVFPELETGAVVALTVEDADGNSVVLRQVNGEWVLPNADDYPAQADKVTGLLDKLVGLTTARLVARTDASHRRLQVAADEFVRRIELETAGGETHILYLGSSPSYGATHFRVEGQSETYLAEDLSAWDINATPGFWVDVLYHSVPQSEVTRMVLQNDNGTFVFNEDGDGNWTMEGLALGESMDQAQVTNLLQRAATVSLLAPLGLEELSEYGMDNPNATVTLETDSGTFTLLVGAQDPDDGSYVVKSSTSDYYVRVAEAGVRVLVESARGDFLQSEPEVEGTPSP